MNDTINSTGSTDLILTTTEITQKWFEKRRSLVHLTAYVSIRIFLAVAGIVGNSITLILLKRLKHRYNGHILMVYLAVTDIFICALVVLTIPLKIADYLSIEISFHKTLCIVKEDAYITALGLSLASYTLVSVDRLGILFPINFYPL